MWSEERGGVEVLVFVGVLALEGSHPKNDQYTKKIFFFEIIFLLIKQKKMTTLFFPIQSQAESLLWNTKITDIIKEILFFEKNETEVFRSKTEDLRSKTEDLISKTEDLRSKTEVLRLKTEDLGPMT